MERREGSSPAATPNLPTEWNSFLLCVGAQKKFQPKMYGNTHLQAQHLVKRCVLYRLLYMIEIFFNQTDSIFEAQENTLRSQWEPSET
jgi:hypothetical protein